MKHLGKEYLCIIVTKHASLPFLGIGLILSFYSSKQGELNKVCLLTYKVSYPFPTLNLDPIDKKLMQATDYIKYVPS